MTRDIDSLAALLEPMSPDRFFAEHHGMAPMHVEGPEDKFDSVMSWDDLNRILSMDVWNGAALELFHDGRKLPPQAYCKQVANRMRLSVMQPDAKKVTELCRRGASLRLNEIETLHSSLLTVVQALAAALGAKVSANAYCSWRAQKALASHFDKHDVFVMHLVGEKDWNIYEGRAPWPIEHPMFENIPQQHFEQMKGRVARRLTMKPGDLLYLPRGQFHDALASTDVSLHVTLSVIEPTGVSWLNALWDMAVQDEGFRAPLPHSADGGDSTAMQAHIKDLAARLARLAESGQALQLAAGLRQSFPIEHETYDLGRDLGVETPAAPNAIKARKKA
ncbi:MAG: cupin domain-containing protein [Rhodovibrionaceae bacterium]|nr:cupin domain-containing protein [Rhodovibrionaceae bacterium]